MWYLSRSSYPKAGLIKKLCASFPDYAAEAAADRMEELGLINDRDYAAPYAADRRTVHKVGVNFSSEKGTVDEWKEACGFCPDNS